jgi:D-lactate dehydrogenase (cytochrome)
MRIRVRPAYPETVTMPPGDFAQGAERLAVIDELRGQLGDRLRTGAAVREQHGHDESYHECLPPDAVAFAASTDDVASVLRVCNAARMPVIPFGVGSSLEGGVSAPYGGVSLDLSGMNAILSVDIPDLTATVQAGVTRLRLNARVQPEGVFFSVDPGADASLGGMVATRASGTTAVRYGTMRDNVLSLTAVLADGTVVRTGSRARKSSAGYDLTRLLIGSEGTLAVVTEVVVRLHPTPETVWAATCSYPDLAAAVNSVVATLGIGVVPARIELLDEVMVGAVNAYSGMDLPVAPLVLYELDGGPAALAEQMQDLRAVAEAHGGGPVQVAQNQADRAKLWRARHDALPAAKALRPGAGAWSTDVCVPISRLAECLLQTQRDVAEAGILAPIAGHVGDGNFHLAIVLDPSDPDELARATAVNEAMVRRAIDMGGTCTGEHGIGLGKREFLRAEAGPAVPVMAAIKRALDPNGILNPGKLFLDPI